MKYQRFWAAFLLGAVILGVAYFATDIDPVKAQSRVWTLRAASGDLTAGETSNNVAAVGSNAVVYLDITKLTLADADDEVDFYVQTSYDGGTNWVDCQNFHYANADNGSTAKVTAVIDGAVDGPGLVRSITGTNPAAGSEISETVPTNAVWLLGRVMAGLTTDATVANRRIGVQIDDASTIDYLLYSRSTQAASLPHTYVFAPIGAWVTLANATHLVPIPKDTVLSSGDRFRTLTASVQAGDNWGAPQLRVEEWHDDAIATDGTLRDDIRAYNRPLGTNVRVKVTLTGATAGTFAYSATVFFR